MADQEEKSRHPTWHGPHGSSELKVYNSLTSTKVPFVPSKGKQVKFYICGPTVYDSSHLGHARAYMTFDIIRRIMADYFGYNVQYVMNVTDIDDKIIMRARRNYLVAEYVKEKSEDVASTITESQNAFDVSIGKLQSKIQAAEERLQTVAPKQRDEVVEEINEVKFKLEVLLKEQSQFLTLVSQYKGEKKEVKQSDSDKPSLSLSPSSDKKEVVKALAQAASGPLGEWLDGLKGASVTDLHIFQAHASKYEKEFLDDMQALGIRDPDCLTRVSEYVPNIVAFIERIIANGFGYKADSGSVYFDTVAFSKKHDYAKLTPWNAQNVKLTEEGEGALSLNNVNEKRNPSDFALWKSGKAGEPSWPSPWGQGRPGWHIECSAMASDILGDNIDVHAGGEDLKFPHHDNELAQSEAASCCNQWINHFWHAGHLHIEGRKMSKSLKNFITIREVLEKYSGRQIRLLFLLQRWDQKMDYNQDALKNAASKEHAFKEFFLNVQAAVRAAGDVNSSPQMWNEADRTLNAKLLAAEEDVHAKLCDNFNFPDAIKALSDLVTETNKYLRDSKDTIKALLLQRVSAFVERILRVLGVELTQSNEGGSSGQLNKFLDAFARFRDQVRESAQKKANYGDILALCDAIRDDIMPELGVRLEDVSNGPSVWKLDDPKVLLAQREEKQRLAKENAIKKLKNQLATKQKAMDKYKGFNISAKDFFASQTDKYSKFDESGKPTHDQEGKEISNKATKALAKAFDKHESLHKEYLSKIEQDPDVFVKQQVEIEALMKQIEELSV